MAARGRPRNFDRDAALRRAMELFWARGYEGVSLSDLTEAMGINAPSLYAAFGSKEALFLEAVALYRSSEGGASWRAIADQPTARQAVEAMLRDNARAYTRPGRPHGCMVVLGAINCSVQNRGVADSLREHRLALGRFLRDRLARAVTEGEIDAKADIDALSAYYIAVLNGLSIQARDGASRKALEAVIDCAMANWEMLTRPGQV
ncbi:TetR/AcrR family transcriptional regulator [Bordetella genomosp. 9]|uniref:TetR family transcriptional regulator n=1 Tax=Bordetella genomosp. 9 TaxID=1416803 RepID=A0A1W6Z3N9_9BORD|nr:TetR/AcrR family transcriptional regulator [Bordetella genomosp. 9]ARP87886.1 TetR family transcriptional regulator [Bordetella genomosp. 9]